MIILAAKPPDHTGKAEKKLNVPKAKKKPAASGKTVMTKRSSPIKTAAHLSPLILEVICIALVGLSLLIILSLFTDMTGIVGYGIKAFLSGLFGVGAYLLPFIIILSSIFFLFMSNKSIDRAKTVMTVFLFFIVISYIHLLNKDITVTNKSFWDYIAKSYLGGQIKNGGLFGALIGDFLSNLLDRGAYILLIVAGISLLILITGRSLFEFLRNTAKTANNKLSQPKKAKGNPENGKAFKIESMQNKKIEVYDVYTKKKPRKIFDHLVEYNSSDGDEKLELINDQLKIKRSREDLAPIQFKTIPDFHAKDAMESTPEESPAKEENTVVTETSDDKEDAPPLEPNNKDVSQSGISFKGFDPPSESVKKSVAVLPNGEEVDIDDYVNASEKVIDIPLEYIYPPIGLMVDHSTPMTFESKAQIVETSRKLEETLKNFGVEARVVEVSRGPTVTRYELSPGLGVKVAKIASLSDDIALGLSAMGIRIEAPVPGKPVVGIEIPNKEPQVVSLKEVIEDGAFQKFPSKLAFALGKDIAGNTVVTDIAKMPHLLIAGSTGSGKSVCVNTLITSIIYKASPHEVKFIMVDPKVVELSMYNGIPHLMIPVVTDPKKAANALNWGVREMERRYQEFARHNVKNVAGYNEMLLEKEETGFMPQIVIIIDELADLMLTAAKEVEEAICRLAQMARAAGIHLVIATQRPSVDVITGLIKANVPSRLAFAVSSGTDSRTILDKNGAEKLLGKGDMLFHPLGVNKAQRIQGAFISAKEIENIVDFIKGDNPVTYDSSMEETITTPAVMDDIDGDLDDFFEEAVDFIVEKDKASISMLQRKFKIGYNRAASIMEVLEERGIVGPDEGSKPRKVIMKPSEWEAYKHAKLGLN